MQLATLVVADWEECWSFLQTALTSHNQHLYFDLTSLRLTVHLHKKYVATHQVQYRAKYFM